jgi:DNA-binding transcriptional LysR family regulator
MATMESGELRIFVKVVQSGSFTQAANLLGTQKTHISRVVTKLEEKLGVRLLERTTRSLSLTEIGREIFERSVSILAEIDEAERIAQKMVAEPIGQLRLTCSVDYGMIAVRKWIAGYLAQYPQVNIEADYTSRIVDLVHEGFDLAIRIGKLRDSSLVARKLGTIKYGLYASPDYLKRHNPIQHPDDITHYDTLAFAGGSYKPDWHVKLENNLAIMEGKPRLKVANHFAVLDACIAGLGLAKLPVSIAQSAVRSGELTQVLSQWRFNEVDVHAVYPSARYLTPKVRAFVDYLVVNFE